MASRADKLAAAVFILLGVSAACGPDPHPSQRSGVQVEVVARGLAVPWSIAIAPDGRMFVTERAGRIRVIVNGHLRARPFLDIRSLVLDNGEQGFLGLAFSPNYAKNRHFYVDYTDRNGDARLVEYKSRGLIRKPKRPKWRPFVQINFTLHKHDSWKHFVDLAYWNVELGEDVG